MKVFSLILGLALVVAVLLFAQSNPQERKPEQSPQAPPAAQPIKPTQNEQSVTGKAGSRQRSLNTTTTGSVGEETPGVQTDNGMAQQANRAVNGNPVNPNFRFGPGAPPNWEQVGQDEALANTNAAAAHRAEIGGPEGTLGVGNALPSYAKGGKPTASSQTTGNQAKAPQNKSNKPNTGGSNVNNAAPKQ